jgi:hypothetical protein
MKRIFKTAVALTLVAALAVPSVAAARSDDRALAQERYYSSYGEPAALPAPTPAPVPAVASDSGAWKVVALGAGALVLVLCGAELVTLSRLRRATVA